MNSFRDGMAPAMRRIVLIIVLPLVLVVVMAAGIVVWDFWQWSVRLPSRAELEAMPRDAPFCGDGTPHPTTSLVNIPKKLVDSFVTAEDPNFQTSPPFNQLLEMERAAISHTPMRMPGITLWLARNIAACSREKQGIGGMRGWHESVAIMSYRVDRELPKEKILDIFLNNIYLGRGAYGIVAGAEAYFGKPLNQLTLGESAFLAALPRRPSAFSQQPESALHHRDLILDRMAVHGDIGPDDAEAAKHESLVFRVLSNPKQPSG